MKVLVVYKKSAWELFKDSEDPNVSAFMAEPGGDAKAFRSSHDTQQQSLGIVADTLKNADADFSLVYRSDMVASHFEDIDLAITVGGDGTFLETSHSVPHGVPALGVNSDPSRSVGFFTACAGPDFPALFDALKETPRVELARAEIIIEGEVVGPPVLNDVMFAHPNAAATTRYRIGDRKFRNSGLLACTAAGSTAWMFQEGGEPMPLDDQRLQFLHRGTRHAQSQFADSLSLESLTRTGQLFVDGEHIAFPLAIGQALELRSGKPLTVIGDLERKRREFLASYD